MTRSGITSARTARFLKRLFTTTRQLVRSRRADVYADVAIRPLLERLESRELLSTAPIATEIVVNDQPSAEVVKDEAPFNSIAPVTPTSLSRRLVDPRIVINEIMYHPSSGNPLEEYIELYNNGIDPVALHDWQFTTGVDFVFPDTTIQANEYLVVAADLSTFAAKYPDVSDVVGGWQGQLSNKGEEIELVDADATRIDRVTYADQGDWAVRARGPSDFGHRGWIWQAGHDGGEKSLELINAAFSNRQGQNWGESVPNGGTPGAANSIVASDIAPVIRNVIHNPAIPQSDDVVTVIAETIDELNTGITTTLFWRVDGEATFSEVSMSDQGQTGDKEAGDGVYAATIPAQPDKTVVEFYVAASDSADNLRTWPAATQPSGEQEANALYQVLDSFDPDAAWVPGRSVIYHQIMTAAERTEFTNITRQSDAQMNATFVSVTGTDIEVRYNAGVRVRGSSSRDEDPPNNRINIPSDRPWQGVSELNINVVIPPNQIAGSALFRLAGLPAAEAKNVLMLSNGTNLRGTRFYVHVEPLNSDFVANQFPDDSSGNLYKGRRPEDSPPGGRGAGLAYLGQNPASYASYTKLTNASEADWSDVIDLISRLNRSAEDQYLENVAEVVDIDQWLRFFALNALLDNAERGLVNGDRLGDDYAMYRGDRDTRFRMIPHDLDTLFNSVDRGVFVDQGIFRLKGNPALKRFIEHPEILPRYYAQLLDLIEHTLLTDEMSTTLDEALQNVPDDSVVDRIKRWIKDRTAFVLSLIPQALVIDSGLPTSGGFAHTTDPILTLTGSSHAGNTRSVLVNGQLVDSFSGDGSWSIGDGVGVTETLIDVGATWRYLDDGSDQGTAWRGLGFDDAPWESGPALLGYGDGNENTVVGFFDTTPNNPDLTRNATTYFRTTFNVENPALLTELSIRMQYDDAAAVYINGVEVVRTNNLPSNAAFDTYATTRAPNEDSFFDFEVPLNVLNELDPGENVIAAEVHQDSPSSSDIKFDLELIGTVVTVEDDLLLKPGVNRIFVEAYDGPMGTGSLLETEFVDIWYDGRAVDTSIRSPGPEVDRLHLIVRDSYLADSPILVRVEVHDAQGHVQRDLWDAIVTLSTDRPDIVLSSNRFQLYNGLGSALITVTGDGPFTLTATLNEHSASRTIDELGDDTSRSMFSGTLSGTSTEWRGIVVVNDDLTVPQDHTLSVAPGTLVLLAGDPVGTANSTSITVAGTLESLGTSHRPVTFTAVDATKPWGQIDINGGSASLTHTVIHRAGNAPRLGHTSSGAAIRMRNSATLTFHDGSITDIRGKILQSTSGDANFARALFSRAVMGPEIEDTSLQFHDNWIVDMAGVYHVNGTVNDNDGIYLHGQQTGQLIELSGGVIAHVQDDAIDTNESEVTITDYIVRDADDKATSILNGAVRIEQSLLVDSRIGVNTKGSGSSRPHTTIDRTTIANVNLGIVAQDKRDQPNVVITYDVTNSIIHTNAGGDAISTDYDPGDISIDYSNVGEVWPGTGNISDDPLFFDASNGGFRLQPGSPSINAADPASDSDPDGTRADQGSYSNGISGAFAPQVISGKFTEDIVLVPNDGPYQVVSNLVIEPGVRMTVFPGTSLYFGPNVQLRIKGVLNARGTPYEPIRFTRRPGTSISWGGIQFIDSREDNRIEHAILEYADTNDGLIGLTRSDLEMDHVTLDHAERRRIRTIQSSLTIRNSTFTDIFPPGEEPTTNNQSEHIWGLGIPPDGQFILENNYFGHITGHNDAIDFEAPRRPNAIPQILNNVFAGGGDDALDMAGDVYVEGNIFRNYRKDRFNPAGGNANVISASAGHYTVVRNVFENVDHVAQVKQSAFMTFVNNTLINVSASALYFVPVSRNQDPGIGALVDGSIFVDTPVAFDRLLPTTELNVHRSVVPTEDITRGEDNLAIDPGLIDEDGSFRLSPSSPAIGAGPNGLDMGASVPAGASISGEPDALTSQTTATITVGGPGIVQYRYHINDGPLSAETSVDVPIQLTDLAEGTYTVFVVGQNAAGAWQVDHDATVSRTWTVDPSHEAAPRLVINEILAKNQNVLDNEGSHPDLVEIHNVGDAPIDLKEMGLSDDRNNPTKFVFSDNQLLGPGEFLTLFADKDISKPGVHLGFSLRRGGEGLHLFDSHANLIDSVTFGAQIPDLSLGRLGENGQWSLTVPTFGAPNVGQATGDPSKLAINEWLAGADKLVRSDFLELYNPQPLPVALGGMFLTDELSGAPDMHPIAPLSFVGANGYVQFVADGDAKAGANHLNFRLSADQEVLAVLDEDLTPIDRVAYYPQTTDVSQGRNPNGKPSFDFFILPTPGGANSQIISSTEMLLSFDDVWRYDDSGAQRQTGWREPEFDDLSWAEGPGALGFAQNLLPVPLITELLLGPTTFYFRKHFTLQADPNNVMIELNTQIDNGAVIYVNGTEVLRLGMGSGQINHDTLSTRHVGEAELEGPFIVASSAFVRADNVIAVEVHQSADDTSDIVFGLEMEAKIIDDPVSRAAEAILGGLRVTEIMYHPSESLPLEFVELQNTSDMTIDLGGVQIRNGIEFTFPAITLDPDAYVLVVEDTAAFTQRYGASAMIAGQYGNTLDDFKLNNAGETLRLEDALGRTIQAFTYDDAGNWPAEADGDGNALEVIDIGGDYDDGGNWQASSALGGSPGAAGTASIVVGRHIFYNNSAFDGNDASANANDDDAIAPDKKALLPGQSATFENYTSYIRGINGVMIDIANLPDSSGMSADDFEFHIGNNSDPTTWTTVTVDPLVSIRQGAGILGSDRVTIIWDDHVIEKQWLQVTVLPTATIGLSAPEIHYWGNAVGDSGDSLNNAHVTATDELTARFNPHNFIDPAPIDDVADYNRDQFVDATDELTARFNATNLITALQLITAPAAGSTPHADFHRASAVDSQALFTIGLTAPRTHSVHAMPHPAWFGSERSFSKLDRLEKDHLIDLLTLLNANGMIRFDV